MFARIWQKLVGFGPAISPHDIHACSAGRVGSGYTTKGVITRNSISLSYALKIIHRDTLPIYFSPVIICVLLILRFSCGVPQAIDTCGGWVNEDACAADSEFK